MQDGNFPGRGRGGMHWLSRLRLPSGATTRQCTPGRGIRRRRADCSPAAPRALTAWLEHVTCPGPTISHSMGL
eukprot:2942520-Prymnesium_polylepis.1